MGEPVLSHTRLSRGEAEPERWLLFLHGIYGSGRNWAGLARRLIQRRPEWGVILADLRLHGGSVGFDAPHTLRAAVEDLRRLEASTGIEPQAALGHSFGGKVALLWAAAHPGALRQVWVVDSTLRTQAPQGSAWRLLEIVRGLPAEFASRDELAAALEAHGYPRRLGLWLGMNLEREGGAFRWRLDWAGVEELLRDYFGADVWPVIETPPGETEVHVVHARESDAIDEESLRRLRSAARPGRRVRLHTLAGGHWVNVDNPDGLLALLGEWLP